jgi:eukaryotic translation initiation factor 2C
MRTLKGVKVEVTHRGNLRKKCRIAGFTEQSADVQTFTSSDGIKTVKEYFNKKYNLKLAFGYLPCLQVGSKERPNYLPMEVRAYTSHLTEMFDSFLHPLPLHMLILCVEI